MSIRRVTSVLTLLALAVLLVPQTVSAKQFRWKLEPGQKFKVEIKQKVTQVVSAMGNTMEIPVDMNFWMTWTVKSANNGEYVITQVIDRMVMNMKAPPNLDLKFDSAKEQELEGPAAMIGQMLKPLVGKTITQTMSDRGEVLKIDIPDEALAGLQANPMGQQLLSKDQLGEMMKAGAPVFPKGDVDKGHSWTSDVEAKLPAVGTMKTTNKYTYVGEETVGDATLSRFDVQFTIDFAGEGQAGVDIKVTDQKNTGSIYFDAAKGQLVKTEMKQNMKMAISGPQEIQQEVKQVMTLTVSPIK